VEATEKAMDEVSGPVVAIGLVLCAVFVPVSFMGGIVGQLYRQFAITISVSVILSVVVALTLTPALCAMMLKPRREIRGPVGAFLRGFNKLFNKTTDGYLSGVRFFLRRAVVGVACLAGLWFGAGSLMMSLPTGFVPNEDQGYFFTVFNLPDGASMERTDQLMRRAEADLKTIPGVEEVLTMGGLNLLTNAYTSNNASIITMLKPWEDRHGHEEELAAILAAARRKFAAYPEAVSLVFPPPPINGLGNASGFVFELQDKVGRDPQELAAVKDKFMQAMAGKKELTGIYSGFSTSIPQIKLDIDRDKARTLNVPVNNVFQGLQIYLGGLQVNDFNLFGRTYKVMLQAEQDFRKSPESINDIFVRSDDNAMVPMSTVSRISMTIGPDILQRYNMFRTAEINGANAAGISTGQALTIMDELAAKELPQGYGYEWTSIAYQEKEAGGTQGPVFAMAMLFVFLVLAAQYESWAVPFSVLLGLPICICGAFLGVSLAGLENNVYVQVGIVALMGLAAKNAILIVEFAKEYHEKQGMGLVAAATEGARLRFRPIMMTAFAFILGVLPLVMAHGAGAAARASIGIAVFAGMLFASTVGLFFIPMLYVLIQSGAYLVGGKREAIQGSVSVDPQLKGAHA
jgi:HAE1 family hydrophobic/amphiphilic exporter-1/multidrug efflux pump